MTRIPASQVESGALTDPGALTGKVTSTTIVPGQQLTEGDFSSASANAVLLKLNGYQRAVAVPLSASQGLVGNLEVGDHVDVIAGFHVQPVDRFGQPLGTGQAHPVVVTLIQDAPVLSVPSSTGFDGRFHPTEHAGHNRSHRSAGGASSHSPR